MTTSLLTSSSTPPQGAEEEVVRLRREALELREALGRAVAKIQKLERTLGHAQAQVAWLHRQVFGPKSERSPAEVSAAFRALVAEQEAEARGRAPQVEVTPPSLPSLQLLLGLVGVSGPPALVAEASPEAQSPGPSPGLLDLAGAASGPESGPSRKRHGRARIPETDIEETVVLEPDPGTLTADARPLDLEVSYRIAIRPAELVRLAVVRPRYAVDRDDGTEVVVAPPPDEMVPRGLFAPSGLAHVISAKFDRHVPYHRLSSSFAAQGVHLPVSTLSGAAVRAAPMAARLVAALLAHAKARAPYVAIDATGAPVQRKRACAHGHVWVRYVEEVGVLVSFTGRHTAETAGALLDGFGCPTVADGAAVYDEKHRQTGLPRGGCWAHARRKLFYALPTDGRAVEGLRLTNALFAVERELVDAAPELRLEERARRSAPLVRRLFEWRDQLLATASLGRSLLRRALGYLRNQEERLAYFLADGRVPIHNNRAELMLRHFVLGRKNWLFFGSEPAAHAASTWLSLVLTARMFDLPVEPYLRDLFRVLPSWPQDRLLELAPMHWRTTRLRLEEQQLADELGPLTVPPPLA